MDLVRRNLADFIAGAFLLFIISFMLRPDSPANDFITQFSSAMTSLITTAVGAPDAGADAAGDDGGAADQGDDT